MHWISYINVNLNLSIPGVARKDTQGHYILTNIGTLGMTAALAPLCPPMHSIGLTCAGKIVKKPLMIDGKVEIQSVINTTSTGDHRFGDASVVLPLCNVFKFYLRDPKNFDLSSFKENVHYSEKDAKK
jgi:pyruvate/2-oxoglutarate dehydrogenase complex dihydrolipoamide acyltransferase (E2) component